MAMVVIAMKFCKSGQCLSKANYTVNLDVNLEVYQRLTVLYPIYVHVVVYL